MYITKRVRYQRTKKPLPEMGRKGGAVRCPFGMCILKTTDATTKLKSLLMKVKVESKNVGLNKAQQSENEDHGIRSITSWEIDGETVETVSDFIF